MPNLCLGTVQFGLDYGVTNTSGRVAEDEVKQILELAASLGIDSFDTAQAYGTSETVLGRSWPSISSKRIISKLSAGASPETWEASLQESLRRLKVSKLDGFLLHRASAFSESDGDQLLDWLESLKERELVDRIGVSIYEAAELNTMPLDRIQIVQIPLSLYDRRLIEDGTVERLRSQQVSIHARSIFLQGLILKEAASWPKFLTRDFRDHHDRCTSELKENGVTLLEAAVGFAKGCQELESILVGVLSANELRQIIDAWNKEPPQILEEDKWSWGNKNDLDPRCWQEGKV